MYTRNIFRSDIVFLMCVSFFVWIIYFLLLRNFYDPFLGDGGGYWRGSTNLLNGFYIEDNQTVTHFNIGYPIFIWFLRTIGFNEYWVVFLTLSFTIPQLLFYFIH